MNNNPIGYDTVTELLDNTSHDHIFFSSDWHIFAEKYDKDKEIIDYNEIIKWTKNKLTEDDVFIYLGDLCHKFASVEDQIKTKKIFKEFKCHKILVLGNHDVYLCHEFYDDCGFDVVFKYFEWNDFIFSHRPIDMRVKEINKINIHGHKHSVREYNITDGDRSVNVYPKFYNNRPITLRYIETHVKRLTRLNIDNSGSVSLPIESGNISSKTNHNAKVYFSQIIDSDIIAYMVSLFHKKLHGKVAIKLHFGERGNNNFLDPLLLEDLVVYTNGTLVDSNVAYPSPRQHTKSHLEIAKEHGFDFAPIDILDADGYINLKVPKYNKIMSELAKARKDPMYIIPVSNGNHLESVSVGSRLQKYDSMVVYTHVKGHEMAGYGGAVKNIGMGIPTGKRGKIQVHGKEFIRDTSFIERLVESASAINNYFKGSIVYVNILANISTKCDCDAGDIHPAMDDIGVLVSDDILAIEQASFDLINDADDNHDVMEVISSRGGTHQIEYMRWLGLGTDSYTLYDITDARLPFSVSESSFLGFSMLEVARKDLKDSQFGIPEDRKFPLDTEKHVYSAIKLFGHAEESKKHMLAKRIKKAANKYGIEIPKTTQCYKYLSESSIVKESNNTDQFITINKDDIGIIDVKDINTWYISDIRNVESIGDGDYKESLEDAIKSVYKTDALRNMYVFTQDCNTKNPIYIGIIDIFSDSYYEWVAQYPIEYNCCSEVNEWAMNACSPIVGIHKPFILKVSGDSSSTINSKQLVLSPDVISDKYLVIDESTSRLKIVDKSYLENLEIFSEYEFVGNNKRIKKIQEAYLNNSVVDSTFFYTALTGKPLLTEDQIDFDESFEEIDIEQVKINMESVIATMNQNKANIHIKDIDDHISIREDINGYYYMNNLNGKRSKSNKDIKLLSEKMIMSILI